MSGRWRRRACAPAGARRPPWLPRLPRQLLLVAASLTMAAAAPAAEHLTYATGAMLLHGLKSAKTYEQGVARGYVGAVADIGAGEPVNGFLFCVPRTVKLEQMGDIVRDWLDKHPESRNYAGKGVVGAALADAFPCPQH